jgi:hypothetical protein
MNDEHYIDGEHNGGVFNEKNLNVYGYCYQNPVLYIDPNGKQNVSTYINGLFSQLGHKLDRLIDNIRYKYKPTRINDRVIIDNNRQAVKHYYHGKGESVVLGSKTQNAIMNNERIQKAISNLKSGKTESPAKHGGSGVDVDFQDDMFHLGRMKLKYNTKCTSAECTTIFNVDDKGFVDPNFVGEKVLGDWFDIDSYKSDNKGDNLEVGGTPYDYDPVIWSIKYKNPGYDIDKEGNPQPIKKDETK